MNTWDSLDVKQQKIIVENGQKTILECIYPLGDIYFDTFWYEKIKKYGKLRDKPDTAHFINYESYFNDSVEFFFFEIYKIIGTEESNKFSFFSKKEKTKYFVERVKLYPFISLHKEHYDDEDYSNIFGDEIIIDFFSFVENKNDYKLYMLNQEHIDFLIEFYTKLNLILDNLYEVHIVNRKKEKKSVLKKINNVIAEEFDKNNDGKLDIIENNNVVKDLIELNQSAIINIDKIYLKNLIQLNNFIELRKQNLNGLFQLFKNNVETDEQYNDSISVIRLYINNYNEIVFHTLNMITAIKDGNLVLFYELFEMFDKLGVFNTNHELILEEKLKNIELKLTEIIYSLSNILNSIKTLEQNISIKLNQLNYTTIESFTKLQSSLNNDLKEIRNGVELTNILTGIQAYQLYKINNKIKK